LRAPRRRSQHVLNRDQEGNVDLFRHAPHLEQWVLNGLGIDERLVGVLLGEAVGESHQLLHVSPSGEPRWRGIFRGCQGIGRNRRESRELKNNLERPRPIPGAGFRNVRKLDVLTTPRVRIRGLTLQGGRVVEYVAGSPAVTASALQPTKVDVCAVPGSPGQYFPKRSDLRVHSQADLDAVAAELNDRPRQTLRWKSPCQGNGRSVALTP